MAIDDFDDICLCGHVRDEHSQVTGCGAEGCTCTCFELDEDATDDVRSEDDEIDRDERDN